MLLLKDMVSISNSRIFCVYYGLVLVAQTGWYSVSTVQYGSQFFILTQVRHLNCIV